MTARPPTARPPTARPPTARPPTARSGTDRSGGAYPVVTGAGIAVPGLRDPADLLGTGPHEGGFDPATGLRGREMRHKDRASRLALCAVAPALLRAGLLDGDGGTYTGGAHTTAVVVSTNFGNLDSVCAFVDTIAEETVTGLSPLGLPHTSSNATAGWIAIRYGLRGPNLTLCNGTTSGLDALYWARNLLAVRRAETVVVVGVEPHTEPASRLLDDGSGRPVLDGAAALVLESADRAAARGARPLAALARTVRAADPATARALALGPNSPGPGLWLATPGSTGQAESVDLAARLGHCSGALGGVQAAAGATYLADGGRGPVLATAGGEAGEAAAALVLTPVGGAS